MMILLTACTILVFSRLRLWVLGVGVAGLLAVSLVIWNDYVRDPSDGHRTVIRQVLKRHQSQRIAGWLCTRLGPQGLRVPRRAVEDRGGLGRAGRARAGGRGRRPGSSSCPSSTPISSSRSGRRSTASSPRCSCSALYGLIFAFALGVAMQARDRFGAFVAVGVAAMIFWQVFENIGMVVGLLPVTGITLPLMSYGGSSMLSVLLSLGLVASIAMRRHMF